ncbi:MAG: hypothetical protein WBF90_18110, partial [Rivularia sp. (in: cyanobacteria)]
HYDGKEYISKTVEEYRKLIKLSSPSDIQLKRIEKIMELAIDSKELNDLINQADEQYAIENNLLEDESLDCSSSSNPEIDRDSYDKLNRKNSVREPVNTNNVVLFPRLFAPHSKKRRKLFNFDIRFVISSFVAVGGMLALVGVAELNNYFDNKKVTPSIYVRNSSIQHHASSIGEHPDIPFSTNANNTEEMPICNLDDGNQNQQIRKYYASFKELENRIEANQPQSSEIKSKVRFLQVKAERQQRKAEENQRYVESQKKQAEIQHHYDKAQKLKDKAQNSLAESQQWLCLSRQALSLIAQ